MKKILLIVALALLTVPQATGSYWKSTAAETALMQQGGIRYHLNGRISTIDHVKLVLKGKTGTLSYKMNGKRIVSNIVIDLEASTFDKDGIGHIELKSYTPQGKLKGRFIGDSDFAECGYLYVGKFVNVNGSSTEFLFTEL